MGKYFNRQIPSEDIVTAVSILARANALLHPEWSEGEIIFNSIQTVRTISLQRNPIKKLENEIERVSEQIENKVQEVQSLEQQLQYTTEINN